MFHQPEGLVIDRDIHMGHLKGCLIDFTRLFFGVEDLPLRFRPSYFPFTEPSAEVDVKRMVTGRDEVRVESDWLEIMGAGMVHPKVLEGVGYDPSIYTGFAFGLGPERIAMLKYGIEDIRLFYGNDIRFLRQF